LYPFKQSIVYCHVFYPRRHTLGKMRVIAAGAHQRRGREEKRVGGLSCVNGLLGEYVQPCMFWERETYSLLLSCCSCISGHCGVFSRSANSPFGLRVLSWFWSMGPDPIIPSVACLGMAPPRKSMYPHTHSSSTDGSRYTSCTSSEWKYRIVNVRLCALENHLSP